MPVKLIPVKKFCLKRLIPFFLICSCFARPVYQAAYLMYFEFNLDAIIETYCVNKDKPQLKCNGQCHLAKQLNAGMSNSETAKSGVLRISQAFIPLYFQECQPLNLPVSETAVLKQNFRYLLRFCSSLKEVPNPPPQFLS